MSITAKGVGDFQQPKSEFTHARLKATLEKIRSSTMRMTIMGKKETEKKTDADIQRISQITEEYTTK